MHQYRKLSLILAVALLSITGCSGPGPISLHPENPHYFSWKGNPAILVGSTEHYGAVLNLDFDYNLYFDALKKDGLNLTRVFTGIYCEHPEAFNITQNTLAPDPGRLICPWARSEEPGYANGGNKFDLSRWDAAYFDRLKDFISQAGKQDVIVELVLFCPYYGDEQWALSPINAQNNINGIGDAARTDIFTLKDAKLTQIQDEMIRKIVTEVNDFDNLIFEICNEPYFAGPTLEWQAHVSNLIRETEADLSKKHLIAQNIQNNSARIVNPDPNIDIFNFHYSLSEAVDWNYHLDKPIGDDETGFAGTHDDPYRLEGWNFLISGGALYDHLDYSFTAGHEDGSFEFPATQPGGGGYTLRRQFGIMKSFIEEFDFIRMRPAQDILHGGIPDGIHARVLANPGKSYALYFMQKQSLATNFSLRWTGQILPEHSETVTFYTVTDDGARLWIDGKLLIDDWTSHAPMENSGVIRLQGGKKVSIRMEYYQGMGGSSARLLWSGKSTRKQKIPNDRFTLPEGNAPGLKVEWFDDTNLENFRSSAVVFHPNFDGRLEGVFPESRKAQTLEPIVDIPSGLYRVEWINTKTGESILIEDKEHKGGELKLRAPDFELDVALRIHH